MVLRVVRGLTACVSPAVLGRPTVFWQSLLPQDKQLRSSVDGRLIDLPGRAPVSALAALDVILKPLRTAPKLLAADRKVARAQFPRHFLPMPSCPSCLLSRSLL